MAAGWTKQGEAMCTDNPHPVLLFDHIARYNSQLIRVLLFDHIARYNSQLIRETTFAQGQKWRRSSGQNYFDTRNYA
jgi:hypothetical protein